MPRPVIAYISTVQSGIGLAASSFYTFTVDLRHAWEAYFPVRVVMAANVSAGPEVRCFLSTNGGTQFASEPLTATRLAFVRASNAQVQDWFRVETGIWAVSIVSGGPNTATIIVETAMVITSIE
ncbi:MAG: hypothetical protein QXG97_00160 [Nitrososphaerota archaeon]